MKYIIIVIMVFGSCSGIKESVVDINTGKKVAGYSQDCNYQLGKTKRSDLSIAEWEKLQKDGLGFGFSNNYAQKSPDDYLTGVGFNGHYSTSKGVKVNDPAQKALATYGKPKAMILDYGKNEESHIHWVYHGLFYKNLTFLTDSSFNTILGIVVGYESMFDPSLNKKYIKKQIR
jgi:hypothetical protein